MGKKKIRKAMESMAEVQKCGVSRDASAFLMDVFALADRVRTISQTSQEMNETSEALDELLAKMARLTANEAQTLSRIW